MIGEIIIVTAIFVLVLILSMVWPPDSPWAPWWRTNKRIAQAMCRLGEINRKDTIYDLGCGDGTALIIAAKEFKAEGVGIEIDPIRATIARIRVRVNNLQERVTIMQKNFFDVSLAEANVVFVYLVPNALRRLRQKFLHELPPRARIISYRYEIDYLPLVKKDEENQLFLYELPNVSKK